MKKELSLITGAIFLLSACSITKNTENDVKVKAQETAVVNAKQDQNATKNDVIELGNLVDVSNTPDEKIETTDEEITSLPIDIETMVDESVKTSNAEVLTAPKQDFSRPFSMGDELPTYASSSDMAQKSCNVVLYENAKSAVYELTKQIEERVRVTSGKIYIASTIIPDQYIDCIGDLSDVIKTALASSTKFEVLEGQEAKYLNLVAQNKGSASVIPLIIREARAKEIPYVATAIVRVIGKSPVVTVRFIKALDGVTLSQSYKKID